MHKKTTRKALEIKPSGRSTDFLTPSFIFGCGFNCSYCYCKRHKTEGVDIATNTLEILTAVDHHAWFADVEKPNQTHPKYVTYDIGCNSDMALHAKNYEWGTVFEFFKQHPIAMGSFATKYVNDDLLKYNPEGKMRIRFSVMPVDYMNILEPHTSTLAERLIAVKKFQDAGYEVHLNFSPVIVGKGWLKNYEYLFRIIDKMAIIYKWDTDAVKAEVIFLTHNEGKHLYNLEHKLPGESLLWQPEIQESKVSQYGGKNIRYKAGLKKQYIDQFVELHDKYIPWNTIRYIF
jgi:spore photoproduct lyase